MVHQISVKWLGGNHCTTLCGVQEYRLHSAVYSSTEYKLQFEVYRSTEYSLQCTAVQGTNYSLRCTQEYRVQSAVYSSTEYKLQPVVLVRVGCEVVEEHGPSQLHLLRRAGSPDHL